MSLPNAASPTPLNEIPSVLPSSDTVGHNTAAAPFGNSQPQRTRSTDNGEESFVDRRREGGSKGAGERRQFGSSHDGLSEAGRELALAIDQYKLQHHRRYITCDEMLHVITSLGYSK